MMRRGLVLVGCLVLAAGAVGIAPSAAKRSKVRTIPSGATARFAVISTSHGYPAVGGRAVQAGVQTTPAPFGKGAVTAVTTVTGISGTTVSLRGTSTAFFRRGTTDLTFSGKATLHGGRVTAVGSGKITGGSGAFRGVHGTFTYKASSPTPTGVVTYRSRGKVTLPVR